MSREEKNNAWLKYNQLEKRETKHKKVSRKPKKQRPKTPHVTTTTDKEKAEDTSFKPKNTRRKKRTTR